MKDGHGPGNQECREIFERLSEYIDGELDADICSRFDEHIGDCPPCVAFLESLRRTVRLLERLPGARLGEEEKAEIVAAYEKLRKEGAGG